MSSLLNVDDLKVPELKEELFKRGLKTSGVKQDLVERLKDFLVYEKEYANDTIRCICDDQNDDGLMISCDQCL